MRTLRITLYIFSCLVLICLSLLLLKVEPPKVIGQTQESTQSFPPDLTPYVRPAIPEDKNPVVRATPTPTPQPPGLRVPKKSRLSSQFSLATAPIFIRDAVVSNTDTTLNATDMMGDTEPTIAVNPANPNEIVITAFSGGWAPNAPLWHSTDGGATWGKQFTIPTPPGVQIMSGPVLCPCDQVADYGRGGRLSITFLVGNTDIHTGTTTNPANLPAWNWLVMGGVTQRTNFTGIGNSDQPWLEVNRNPMTEPEDDVYVGYDNFNGGPNMQVSVARGTNPPNFIIDNQSGTSTATINPGHRLAVDPRNGAVYSLFQRSTGAGAGGSKRIDYMLNRSTDGGATWNLNGMAMGITVASADSTQPQPKFGTVNALLGGVLSATVDPTNGDVYYVFGNRDSATGNNRLSIIRLTDNGAGGLTIGAPSFVSAQTQAALPSVAVTNNGTVGVLFTTFDGFGAMSGLPVFTAHLALSSDHGATFTDRVLSTFLSVTGDSGASRQRVLGDYQQMKSVGNTFFGVFTGNGVPFGRPFANHDPIFFKIAIEPDIQAPNSVTFADTCVGATSVQNFMVCNNGAADLKVNSITSSDSQFSIAAPAGGFPVTIACGACFTFQARFTPTSAGAKSATLTIASNDPDTPSAAVPVSGVAKKLQSITCPPDMTVVTANPGDMSVVVNYPPPTIVDSSCAVSVVASKPSGSSFPLGTTTVTITATDAANQSVSCSFKVTVFDVCLQDDASGDVLFFNSFTGDYKFIRCGVGGFTATGKGKITRVGCLIKLDDAKVHATLDRCIIAPLNRGSATFKPNPIAPVFLINDSNTKDDTCMCP